jgi:cytochrome c6
MRTRLVIFGIFVAICVLLLPFVALQKEGSEAAAPVEVVESDQAGKELFATNCGTCHTLDAAGADGVVGPNLDDLFATNPDPDSRKGIVMNAVENGIQGRMPARILSGENAQLVAEFVAEYAAR